MTRSRMDEGRAGDESVRKGSGTSSGADLRPGAPNTAVTAFVVHEHQT